MPPTSVTLLDACTVINLFASRREADILDHGGPFAVCDVVQQEALFAHRGGSGDEAREPERINLEPLVTRRVLTVVTATGDDELTTFIDLAQELDDGEAMTAALAIHRRLTVVTDDKKAIRVLTAGGVTVTSSLHLVKAWADDLRIDPVDLRGVLTDIRDRGSYLPPRSHPLHGWWSDAIEPPSTL